MHPSKVAALYASVDFEKKRQERLLRQTRMAPDGESDSTNENTPTHVGADSPKTVYRDLPPIPIDDGFLDNDSKNNDSMGQKSASSIASTVFTIVDNDLYGDDSFEALKEEPEGIMVDNELYNISKTWT